MTLNYIAQQIVDCFKESKYFIENLQWQAYYSKYNEECLCFQSNNWNFRVSNLVDKELTENKAVNSEKLRPFYEYLGERIALSLNILRGKTNEELKEIVRKKSRA